MTASNLDLKTLKELADKMEAEPITHTVICSHGAQREFEELAKEKYESAEKYKSTDTKSGIKSFLGVRIFSCRYFRYDECLTLCGKLQAHDVLSFIEVCQELNINWRILLGMAKL